MSSHDARDLNLNIDKAELKALYQTKPYIHAIGIALNWAIIATVIYLSTQFFHPLLYVFAVIVIGARMHALAILMHDASHFRFLKNRKLNDLVTNLVSMYPLFTSIEQYRPNHLKHHRHLNTENDPDWVVKLGRRDFTFPKTKREFYLEILAYFTMVKGIMDAIWFLKRFAPSNATDTKSKKQVMWPRLVFTLALVVVLSVLGIWPEFLMYWIVPYLSTFFMFQYIRSVAEHFGELAYEDLLTSTRTYKVSLFEQFFFAPHNVGYHLEHHLYPGVPYYNLPKLHNLLMKDAAYNANAHITIGFFSGLVNELGSKKVGKVTVA